MDLGYVVCKECKSYEKPCHPKHETWKKIQVMQAYLEGKDIEYKDSRFGWTEATTKPIFIRREVKLKHLDFVVDEEKKEIRFTRFENKLRGSGRLSKGIKHGIYSVKSTGCPAITFTDNTIFLPGDHPHKDSQTIQWSPEIEAAIVHWDKEIKLIRKVELKHVSFEVDETAKEITFTKFNDELRGTCRVIQCGSLYVSSASCPQVRLRTKELYLPGSDELSDSDPILWTSEIEAAIVEWDKKVGRKPLPEFLWVSPKNARDTQYQYFYFKDLGKWGRSRRLATKSPEQMKGIFVLPDGSEFPEFDYD